MSAQTSLSLTEIAAGVLGTGALGAAGMKLAEVWLSKRRTPTQQMGDAAGSAAQLIELALKASGTSVQQLLAEVKDLKEEMQVLRSDHEACERKNVELGQQVEALTQQGRQQAQRIDSLLRELSNPRSTQPGGSLSGAVIAMENGGVTVTRPNRRKPK